MWHLAEIYKNRDCATFGKLMMNPYFLRIVFIFYFIFSGNFPCTLSRKIAQFWGTWQLPISMYLAVSELKECLVQFLSLVLGYHPWMCSSQAEGWAAYEDFTISIIKARFPSWIVQFLEVSPKSLQGQFRRLALKTGRLALDSKDQISTKTNKHKHNIKDKS